MIVNVRYERAVLQVRKTLPSDRQVVPDSDEFVVFALVAPAEIIALFADARDLETERDHLLPDSIEVGLKICDSAEDVVALVLQTALLVVSRVDLVTK